MYIKYFRQTVTESQQKILINDPFQQQRETVTDYIRVRRL